MPGLRIILMNFNSSYTSQQHQRESRRAFFDVLESSIALSLPLQNHEPKLPNEYDLIMGKARNREIERITLRLNEIGDRLLP
jgi:hypothetical protein